LWKTIVNRDERVEAPSHGIEEVAIVEVTPAHFGSHPDLVSR
jgi:hypothetical protein